MLADFYFLHLIYSCSNLSSLIPLENISTGASLYENVVGMGPHEISVCLLTRP